MVQKDGDIKLDSFESEIESAIDDLFNPSKNIEIDPVTSSVREVGELSDAEKEKSLEASPESRFELENEPVIISEAHPLDMNGKFERCLQHLLTLEWEVTDANIGLARSSIDEFFEALGPDERPPLKEFQTLIGKFFDLMLTSPGSLPMDGLKTLQQSLEAVKEIASGGPAGPELASASIAKLSGLVLGGVVQPVPGLPATDMHAQVAPPAPAGNLEEMEPLELEIEGEPLLVTKAGDAVVSSGDTITAKAAMAEAPPGISASAKIETPDESSKGLLPPGLYEAINGLMDDIDGCIGRMLRAERLMANTEGMEKLFMFYKGIREDLERGRIRLCEVSPCFDRPLPYTESDIAVKKQAGPDKKDAHGPKQRYEVEQDECPWTRLFMTSWGGKTVALIPGEIAFKGKTAWWTGKKIKDMDLIPLKILRSWPWAKIGALIEGELSKKDESELTSMLLPVLRAPWPASAAGGKGVVVILYADGCGAALLADAEPLLFPIQREWIWKPGEDGAPHCLGTIKNNAGESIPVISVTVS
ncbi:MAG: hypothetical protein M0022_04680 [Desulfobacteraceae bacterium]|nr:hypothetical protein [Desulfobacteraceae bacterium]